jgi:hypothetical protein
MSQNNDDEQCPQWQPLQNSAKQTRRKPGETAGPTITSSQRAVTMNSGEIRKIESRYRAATRMIIMAAIPMPLYVNKAVFTNRFNSSSCGVLRDVPNDRRSNTQVEQATVCRDREDYYPDAKGVGDE